MASRRWILSVVTLAIILSRSAAFAQKDERKTACVILITVDGLRHQELFGEPARSAHVRVWVAHPQPRQEGGAPLLFEPR